MTWRAIQDNVSTSVSLAHVSDFSERLYWRVVAQTDAWGRLRGEPAKVRAQCIPLLRDKTDEDVAEALIELERAGRLRRYAADGRELLQVVDFDRNQPRDAIRRKGESKFPAPEEMPQDAAHSGDVRAASSGTLPSERERQRERESSTQAERSGTSRENGLPIDREFETQRLLEAIGKDADANTPVQIRALASRVPESSLAKVRESVLTQQPRNRAAYAVGALQSEFAELANRRGNEVPA